MTELPISEYVKKYYEAIGFELSDFDKAAIYWNSERISYTETVDAIKEIAEATDDGALRSQIMERIEYEDMQKHRFTDNEEGKYVYTLAMYDDGSDIHHFSTVERALAYAKENLHTSGKTFGIKKEEIDQEGEGPEWEMNGIFDLSGELIHAYTVEEYCEPNDAHGKLWRFENAFLYLKFPFKRGDVVRSIDNGELGVVENTEQDWEGLCRRIMEEDDVDSWSYWDFSEFTMVDWIMTDGGIGYAHRNMLELEIVPKEETVEWEMYYELGKLLNGKNKLANFVYWFDQYRKFNWLEHYPLKENSNPYARVW